MHLRAAPPAAGAARAMRLQSSATTAPRGGYLREFSDEDFHSWRPGGCRSLHERGRRTARNGRTTSGAAGRGGELARPRRGHRRTDARPLHHRHGSPAAAAAADGGAYLKSIPGFALSRKGGTGGDPALRGLGGSRLNILLDDARILGGCGMRMDPPTAYVFPEAYDRIEVIKGPQSVRYGATIAGIVNFDREPMRFTESTTTGFGSTTIGSWDRQDFVGDITVGDRAGYVRLIGNVSTQDDYDDGAGREVHSQYERWSTSAILGWTPDELTHVEFTVDRSDAEAAYDDRGMDGVVFDRSGYSLKLERGELASWLPSVEALLFYNYVDHVMDNYTLRAPAIQPMVSYPD